jgi:hypothetical protein
VKAALLALARCLGFAAGLAHAALKRDTRDLHTRLVAEREYRDAMADARARGVLHVPPPHAADARPN